MKKPIEYATPLDRDAAELHRALTDLIRVYQFRDRRRICCHDISVTQCYALDVLAAQGPVLLRELASALYLDTSTASRVVDSLESAFPTCLTLRERSSACAQEHSLLATCFARQSKEPRWALPPGSAR